MKKLVLMVGAVAVLAVLLVLTGHLLGTVGIPEPGESGGVPLQTAEHASTSRAAIRTDATARVPLATSPSDEGTDVAARAVVEGMVRDATGAPLAGARITARLLEDPRAGGAPSQATTDARGSFALMLPPDALAELSFACSGFRPISRRVRAPSIGLDVVLERSPVLRGRVVRRDGVPVGGALVRWSNPHLALGAGETTTSGADGRFAFLDVPWGLDLEILAPDALPVFRSVQVTWGMGELVVGVDGGREGIGRVVDSESGAGIADARVELWYYRSTYTAEGRRGGPSQRAETTRTRADGGFTLTRLPSAPDRSRPDAWLWVTAPGRAPHWKIVKPPERAGDMHVVLYPAGSVRGRVVDAAGAPLAGQRVFAEASTQPLCEAGPDRAFRQQHGGYSVMWSTRRPEATVPFHAEREAFTDAAGAYVIDGIPCPAGGGEVTITLPAGRPRVTVVTRSGEVAVAEDIVRPEDLFRRWHGLVRDERARPVAGATIELSIARTASDARGRFDFEVPGDVQGELLLRASAPGYVPFRRVLVPSRGLFCECDVAGVTITLARGVRLAILVLDRSQRPVPDASVQVFPAGGLADFAKGGPRPVFLGAGRSDDHGAVLLEDVPETCDVLLEYPRSNTPTYRRTLEAVKVGAGTLRVVLEDLDLFAAAATLTVRVIDERVGAAFEGPVLVEATSENETRRSLALGPEIRLDGLSLGKWEVSVAAEGLGARTARVELPADGRIDVRLGQGVAISGLVACGAGPPARPLQVQAREVASKRLTLTRTDTMGRFALAGMEPGEYLLSVEPFESSAFTGLPVGKPQSHASPGPVKLRVQAGTVPETVTLPVVPVALLRVVVVAPDADARAAQSVWSWAQDLHFAITDDQGRSVYAGGPSGVMAAAAELSLCLAEGRYIATVRRRGEVLAQRALAAGESWRLERQ
ncbi:MAG: carboxypeptidase regulatory-like domain-containing protein [Planctomycetes bacterium]|nr:carboxypeptidase regulatory-like domain-containing protein [Planctomycetota bacterium]